MDKTASFLYKAFIRKYLKQTKQTKKKKAADWLYVGQTNQ